MGICWTPRTCCWHNNAGYTASACNTGAQTCAAEIVTQIFPSVGAKPQTCLSARKELPSHKRANMVVNCTDLTCSLENNFRNSLLQADVGSLGPSTAMEQMWCGHVHAVACSGWRVALCEALVPWAGIWLLLRSFPCCCSLRAILPPAPQVAQSILALLRGDCLYFPRQALKLFSIRQQKKVVWTFAHHSM